MLTAQYEFVRRYVGIKWPFDATNVLQVRSAGGCREGSATTLHYLITHYPLDFKFHLMLKSKPEEREAFKANPEWVYHYLFATQAKNGVWFAGSPANYNPKNESSFTRIIAHKSIEEVLGNITEEVGGIWPSADFISDRINTAYTFPYTGINIAEDRYVNVCEAAYEKGANNFDMRCFYLNGFGKHQSTHF
jgi:hypothetical protein